MVLLPLFRAEMRLHAVGRLKECLWFWVYGNALISLFDSSFQSVYLFPYFHLFIYLICVP